jgi:ArsR family transcriptional regulator, virulence genes transcriptional regulator
MLLYRKFIMLPVNINKETLQQLNFNGAVSGLKAIADPSRLQILCSLTEGELTVGDLVKKLDLSQSAVSQHLSKMKSSGMLTDRRDGNQVYYRLHEPIYAELVTTICRIYNR